MIILYHFRPGTGYVDQLMLKQMVSLKQLIDSLDQQMAILDQQMTIASQTMFKLSYRHFRQLDQQMISLDHVRPAIGMLTSWWSINDHLKPANRQRRSGNDYRILDHVRPSYHHFRLLDQRMISLGHVRPDNDYVDQQKTSLNQLMTILEYVRPSKTS